LDFDQYSTTYEREVERAIGFAGREHGFFLDAKAEAISGLCRRRGLDTAAMDALDVGCGVGLMASRLAPGFRAYHGVDPSEESIPRARMSVPQARFDAYDGRRLPFGDDRFDLAMATLVFHHVPPAQWAELLTEMKRVVRPGGLVVLVEHNPWNPLTRLAVRQCEFDRDAVLMPLRRTWRLFLDTGLRGLERRFFLFLPWRLSDAGAVAWVLAGVPFGAQYLVAGSKVSGPAQ
jgi:SAM-dependent methyltransferase